MNPAFRNILNLARQLAVDMEAEKHHQDGELLEVRLLHAIEAYEGEHAVENHYTYLEVLRDSDIAQGGSNPQNPPLPGAQWDAEEKRWLIHESDRPFEALYAREQGYRFVPQQEGPHLIVIAIEDG